MARKVKQLKYYPNNTTASTATYEGLRSGNAFRQYLPIVQLGIQTMPGVIFRLNGANNPIMVGSTGIYELNVSDGAAITSLNFDASSLTMIEQNPTGYLIVDILYDNEGV